MKYEIKVHGITRRLPRGCRLPVTFQSFVETCRTAERGAYGWFSVKWTSPNDLLGFDARDCVLPVLRMSDGGFVALWFRPKNSPSVIHCGSEGEASLIAANWADFLLRLTRRKTSIPDVDDRESAGAPKVPRLPKRMAALGEKRRSFAQWIIQQSPDVPSNHDEAEAIRRELQRLLANEMAAEIRAMTELYGGELDDDDATVDLVVHLTTRTYKVRKIGGQPFPRPERLLGVLRRLVTWQQQSLKSCEICIWANGCVFVDGASLGDPRLYSN